MRRKAIKDYLLSKFKPGASSKEVFDAVGYFMNNKCRLQRNIILKEDDQIITDTNELCEIFSTFFSSCANNIGQPDEIDMSELDFLMNIINRHKNHKSILAIRVHHKDVPGFDFKPVKEEHIKNLLHKLDMNKATGYYQITPKIVKLCSKQLSKTLTELVNNPFKQNIVSDDMTRAEVTPIFMKKYDMIKNNYRPVSILSFFSKDLKQ